MTIPVISSWLLASCINDDLLDSVQGNPEDQVTVGAYVNAAKTTRGYIEEGEINDGTFYMIYNIPGSSSTYGHAKVEFGKPEGPTTGYAYFMDGDTEKELKWGKVYGGGSEQTFYLSNISPDRYTTSSTTSLLHWRFPSGSDNPFVASPLDKTDGVNDIVLDAMRASNATGKIPFELDHVLSLLKVTVDVYGASDNYFVDLSNAEVTLTDVCKTLNSLQISSPTSFSYSATMPTSGSTYRDPGFVTLVDPASRSPYWDNDIMAPPTMEDGVSKKRYVTKEFVMPPQSIPPSPLPPKSDDYTAGRPKLSVKVPRADIMGGNGEGFVTYSGYIPEVMFRMDDQGNLLPTPENIALLSGHQLNIRATINSPETDLVFAPVVVEPWASKGSFSVTTKQAGIYNEKNFRNMVIAYKEGDIRELERYGYWDGEGNFVFQIWAGLSLSESEIRGCLTEPGSSDMPDSFCFLLNGYTFTLAEKGMETPSDKRLEGCPGQIELHNIVSGKNEEFIGVRTTEHLRNVLKEFSATNLPNIKELSKHVLFNNSENILSVQIMDMIDIPIAEIFQKVDAKAWGYNVVFSNEAGGFSENDGAHINAVFSEEDNVKLPLVVRNGYDVLNKIMYKSTAYSGNITLSPDEELYLFAEVVNIYYRYFPDLMPLFANYKDDSKRWNFQIGTMSSIIGSKVFNKFVNDSDPGRPDTYLSSLNVNNSVPLEIIDDKTPFKVSYQGNSGYQANSLRPALDGSGGQYTFNHLSNVVKAYTSTADNRYLSLWKEGKYENGKWLFYLYTVTGNTWTPTATYEETFGQMIPDEDAGRYDYEFRAGAKGIQVTGVPVPGSSSTTTITFYNTQNNSQYPNDMPALKAMCNGTYWDLYEEWKASKN